MTEVSENAFPRHSCLAHFDTCVGPAPLIFSDIGPQNSILPTGAQKNVYEFQNSGDVLTGQATFEHSMDRGSVKLESLKVDGDKVSFVERLSINGNEITVTYNGTLTGDELKLTRDVGQFGTEQLTAMRAQASH